MRIARSKGAERPVRFFWFPDFREFSLAQRRTAYFSQWKRAA